MKNDTVRLLRVENLLLANSRSIVHVHNLYLDNTPVIVAVVQSLDTTMV